MNKPQKRRLRDGLPPNLYSDKKSFIYRTPDGVRKSLGTNKKDAVEAAIALNAHFASKAPSVQEILLSRLAKNNKKKTLSSVIEEFQILKEERSKSERTMQGHRTRLAQYTRTMGDTPVDKVTILYLNEWMDKYALTHDVYRQHRILLRELFMFARSRGYMPAISGNPADDLLSAKLARTKFSRARPRMPQSDYDEIFALAPKWLRIAMEISRQTGLRRMDISLLRYSQVTDDILVIIPGKTPSLELHIKIGATLKATIAASRELVPTDCPFICHKRNRNTAQVITKREHVGQITPEQITREFKKCVIQIPRFAKRAKGKIPTFHEIRSLCSHLYKEKGRSIESVKNLLGHADEEMTEVYQSGHKREIVETWADL